MPQASDSEKRVKARKRLQLRVDARIITEQERIDILAGLGHPDLENEGLALTRPRWGMVRTASQDVSASGLRLQVGPLGELSPGTAVSLDVHLPGEQRVVKLLGDVMWSGQHEGLGVAGLRIAALELEGHQRLIQTLQTGLKI